MSCLDRAALASYWLGDLAPEEEARVDEHLLGCGPCAAESARFAEIAQAVRRLARQARMPGILSPALRDTLAEEGFRMKAIEARAGETSRVEFSPGVDLVIIRLRAPIRAGVRYDVELTDDDGRPVHREEQVPAEAERGELLVACQRHYLDLFPRVMRLRVQEVGPEGTSLVGEYRLDHGLHEP